MAAHGFPALTAVTALTVQSMKAVRKVQPVGSDLLAETLASLEDAFDGEQPIAGVKIGMLATAENVEVVAAWLRTSGIPRNRVVLDPVIRSSSGAELLEPTGVRRLVSELLPVVGWVTPNLAELGALLGESEALANPIGRQAIPGLAKQLAESAPGLNVVVTGGHLDSPDDFLLTSDGDSQWFPGNRVEARGLHGSHGTGCVFSSALLCRLLLGDQPGEAVAGAKAWVVRRLEGCPEDGVG